MPNEETKTAATLGDLFPFSAEEVAGKIGRALATSETGDDREENPAARWTGPIRSAVAEEVSRRFSEVLDVKISDVVTGAFDQYVALVEYTNPAKYPPGDSIIVPMGHHSIESAHRPKIDVLMNDKVVLSLELAIDLAIEFESVVLRIDGGRIYEIRPGRASAKGSVKFRNIALVERESAPVDFPGTIRIEQGLSIRPQRAGSQSASNRAAAGNS